jgi:hypothetical protein
LVFPRENTSGAAVALALRPPAPEFIMRDLLYLVRFLLTLGAILLVEAVA